MLTKLELQTAPGSAFGTIGQILSRSWEPFAGLVERRVNEKSIEQKRKSSPQELILWRLTYNLHIETEEEFERTEFFPRPLIFGKVSLIQSNNLWEIAQYPYVIEFNSVGFCGHKKNGGVLYVLSDEDLLVAITDHLLGNK